MKHRKKSCKLNRTSSHRSAMFRNMITSLLKHGSIKTTLVKAKEVGRLTDKIITLAKKGDLHSRRQAISIIREKKIVHNLFENIVKKFSKINGGYTRVLKINRRIGDSSPMAFVEMFNSELRNKDSV